MLLDADTRRPDALRWLIPLGVLLVARQAWAIVPFGDTPFQAWVSSLIPLPINLGAAALCLWVSRHEVDARASWRLIGFGMLSFAFGDMIYGFLQGKGAQWAVECGAAHGALAMTTPGDTSMASLAEVENVMKGGAARVAR